MRRHPAYRRVTSSDSDLLHWLRYTPALARGADPAHALSRINRGWPAAGVSSEAGGVSNYVECSDAQDLVRVFGRSVNTVVWHRARVATIEDYVATDAFRNEFGQGTLQVLEPSDMAKFVYPDASCGRELFLSDLGLLTQMYFDLLGCPRVGMRIEVLRHAMCPRFHVDRVGIRMLCTYLGPGTECVEDTGDGQTQRDPRLVSSSSEGDPSVALNPPATVHRVPPFAVTLLKGEAWQDNEEHGAIHRSPPMADTESYRVLAVFDGIWAD